MDAPLRPTIHHGGKMGRTVRSNTRAIIAADNSSRSTWKSNQRLGDQLQRKPAEDYKVVGGTQVCGHGVSMEKHPDHNCMAYENERRAARGAPPLET